MFVKESPKNIVHPCLNSEQESSDLVVAHLDVAAGLTLTDISDARYQKTIRRREELGRVVLRAASASRNVTNSEDHTEAVISVTRAIDTYMLSYALNRSDFDAMQNNYAQDRKCVASFLWTLHD